MRAKHIKTAKLVVVKLGTGILSDNQNCLASSRIKQLAGQIVRAKKKRI